MALVIFAIALIQSIVDIVKLGISAYRKRAGAR